MEIPIWFQGKIKWISNLTSRSTCSDVIQAILFSINNHLFEMNENYDLYEYSHGVERVLKSRCHLLKLWKSWTEECQYVILTLRCRKETLFNYQQEKQMCNYLILTRLIKDLNYQINQQNEIVYQFNFQIIKENYLSNEFFNEINETLISSRQLTCLSNQIEKDIIEINEEIDRKLVLLDQLELDDVLEENIHLQIFDDHQQQIDPIISIKTFIVATRPTAIVQPNSFDKFQSKELLGQLSFVDHLSKEKKHLLNEQMSSLHSQIQSTNFNDQHFVTLV